MRTSWLNGLWNWSYCRLKLYIVGMGMLDHFCSCDLDLDPMTFIYEPDPYSLEIYRMCKNELPASRLSTVITWKTYRQRYSTEIIYHAVSWVVKNASKKWHYFCKIFRRRESLKRAQFKNFDFDKCDWSSASHKSMLFSFTNISGCWIPRECARSR